jgi:hypothetical protein
MQPDTTWLDSLLSGTEYRHTESNVSNDPQFSPQTPLSQFVPSQKHSEIQLNIPLANNLLNDAKYSHPESNLTHEPQLAIVTLGNSSPTSSVNVQNISGSGNNTPSTDEQHAAPAYSAGFCVSGGKLLDLTTGKEVQPYRGKYRCNHCWWFASDSRHKINLLTLL